MMCYIIQCFVSGLKVRRSLLSVYNVRGYHISADSTHRSQQFKLTNQNVHITLTMTNCCHIAITVLLPAVPSY